MADERIDVVVTDGVDANVEKKLIGIANAADKGETYLKRLQAAISNVNTSSVDRLAAAMAKVDSAQAKLISAQARLTNAQNAGSVAANRNALAQQKIATEAARTEAAQQRAAQATSGAAAAAMRLQAAQTAATGASTAAANAQQQLAAATTQAGTAASGAGNQFRQYVTGIQAANTAANGAVPAGQKMAAGMNAATGASNQYLRAQRQTTAANANIIAQIQDIGVSLAGGQNPLLVAIQQGSQLSYIASTMEGGLKQLLATVGRMALAWAPLIAAIGAAIYALQAFNSAINEGANMDEYVNSLGLTRQELKKLEDQTVTMGDTMSAVWSVTADNLAASMGVSTKEVQEFFSSTADNILSFMRYAFIGIGAGAVALVVTIDKITRNIKAYFHNAGVAAAQLFVKAIEWLVNQTIKGINVIGDTINMLSNAAGMGDLVGQLDAVKFSTEGMGQAMMKIEDIDFMGEFNKAARNADNNLKAIGARAEQNAKDRLAAAAKEIKLDRTPKTGSKGPKAKEDNTLKKRAAAMDKLNLALDNELSRMSMLKDARAIQQRMDQIDEQMAQKKIKWHDGEREAILAKVTAIEQYKYQQAEMDRLYEEATAPLRTYNASLAANSDLLKRKAIDAQQASQNQVLANRTYQESVDPLFAMKEAMTANETASRLYGAQLEQNNFYEAIRLKYLEKGIILGVNSTAAINAEVAALMKRNDVLREQNIIQSAVAAITDPIIAQTNELANKQLYYDELQRLRDTDYLNEQNYQRAKWALDAKFNEMRLSAASDFFGTLAGITSNGTGAIGAISKAAAVAQATMDGFVAAQKALASAPPPFNYIAAAAVALKTGSNVAGILSTNVGNFKDGGEFMVGGKSGIDANNINMNVTKGERVKVETPAQQRAADAAGGGGNVELNQKIVNVFDTSELIAAMDSQEGEDMVINIITRRKQDVAAITGNPNG